MSTDSTELTFVRCPSCRSLVPAVSTRCRMCGASLDATSQDDASGDDKKSGRVRQRTMSAPKSDLSAAAQQIRAESASPADEAPSAGAERREIPIDDPLSAYVEEVDADDAPSAEEKSEAASPSPDMKSGPARTYAPDPKVAPAFTPASPTNGEAHTHSGDAQGSEGSKPRVILESGPRRGGKPSGLSFGKGRDEKREEPAEASSRAPEVKETAPEPSEPPRQQQSWKPIPRDDAESRRERPASPPREEARPEPPREREARREEYAPRASVSSGPAHVEKKGQAGRLFGWLVSYKDPTGTAIELREGKFFITGSQLKPNDLLIQDPSVSTPHAMVIVGGEGGFQVRDLMSERGVHVKRRDSGSFQRETDDVQVRHGDWVKFGDVEFLVSLIAHVGAK